MPYMMGLLEGFQSAREEAEKRNYEREVQNRQFADRVFQHLMTSNDPEMRSLALSGLAEPITGAKKKGFAGYLGQYRDTNPYYASALARSQEMIPSQGVGGVGALGAPPPGPPPFQPERAGTGVPTAHDIAAHQAMQQRGFGVPTPEETAEMQARAPLQAKLNVARQQLQAAGLPPAEIQQEMQRLLEGMLGAPRNQRQFAAPTFGVKLPNGHVSPVSFDYTTGTYTLADGKTPYDPNTMEMVRMTGGGAGMSLSTKIQDTPENRARLIAELQAQGADPAEIAMIQAGSSTRWWRRKEQGGVVMVAEDTPFVPPQTAFGQGLDASGNNALIALPRNAPPGTVVATPPGQQTPSLDQSKALALLDVVNQRIRAEETPALPRLPRKILTPAEKDQRVKQAATEAGLPYTTMYDLVAATKVPPARQQTPRANAPQGTAPTTPNSDAQEMLQYMLEQRRKNATPSAPPPPPAPPRAGGPGPVGAGR